MIRPYSADKTPPTIALEARERDVGQESPRVSERDLTQRLRLGRRLWPLPGEQVRRRRGRCAEMEKMLELSP